MSSAYFGQGFLYLATLIAFVSCSSKKVKSYFAYINCLFIAIAFAILIWAHITSDFSYLNVFEYSHTAKPLLYKISGVWGSHEGSMLLWVVILALFTAIAARSLPLETKEATVRVLSVLILGFLLFILIASDPFVTLATPPLEGQDLNPLLQDPSLAIHPPILYAGYVSSSVPFALCIAILSGGRLVDKDLATLRLWALVSWTFMTAGLALGSFWAYYELGWGGFWFWDPVENAALLPWLSGTALLHSVILPSNNRH